MKKTLIPTILIAISLIDLFGVIFRDLSRPGVIFDAETILFIAIIVGFLIYNIVAFFVLRNYKASIVQKTFLGSFWGMVIILIPFSYSLFFPSQFSWEFMFYLLGIIPMLSLGALFGWISGMFGRTEKKYSDWIIGVFILIIIILICSVPYLNQVRNKKFAEDQKIKVTENGQLYKQALNTLDISYCNQISYEVSVKQCQSEVLALKGNDVSFCNNIFAIPDKLRCYETYAKQKNDFSVCAELKLPPDLKKYSEDCFNLTDIGGR